MSAMVAPTPSRRQELDDKRDKAALFARLMRYEQLADKGEGARRACDTRGAKLRKGNHWETGPLPGRLAITSNQATAIYDRHIASYTRYSPLPIVEAKNAVEDESAMTLEGALVTLWETTDMTRLLKQSRRLVGFTRPALWYVYWDQQARGGIGEIKTRLVPGFRTIIDNRVLNIDEMEFVGFYETMTRAKVIQLFPDKTKEIEDAMASVPASPPGVRADPLETHATGASNTRDNLDRVVSDAGGPYVGLTSVKQKGGRRGDPLAEEIQVKFLWIDDPTPDKEVRPKRNPFGEVVRELVRHPETGEIQFDTVGHMPVQTPFGPMFVPNLQPRTQVAAEEIVVKKYKHRRHVAWIPGDKVILWDVKWNGPIPLADDRDDLPINGYWCEGKALRLCSLAVARNIFLSIIFDRLKLSLAGGWLASQRSGFKRNKLIPEVGLVFQVNDVNEVKPITVNPVEPAYFEMVQIIESEMMKLIGLSDVSMGQPAGRADAPQTYDKLLEAGGTMAVDDGQLLENTLTRWARIVVWFMQHRYTHEHVVEVENEFGTTTWKAASALAVRGEYAIRMDIGSMMAMSESAKFERAKEYSAMGIYTLPMLVKVGHVPFGRRALKQKVELSQNPQLAQVLMGGAGASPGQQAMGTRVAMGKRSHHRPGGS